LEYVKFLLTIFVDLTIAIGVGVTMASLLFMARMSESVEISKTPKKIDETGEDYDQRMVLSPGVEVFEIAGPVFFGMVRGLMDIFKQIGHIPKVLIIRMRLVPYLDGTGAAALNDLVKQCYTNNTKIIFSSVQNQPARMLSNFQKGLGYTNIEYTPTYDEAVILAKEMINKE
jgi:sulfate permease, SulP family